MDTKISVYPSALLLGYSETIVTSKKAAAVMYTPLSSDVISSKINEYFHIKHENEEYSIHPTGCVPTTCL
jgi:hypothetical protein